LWLLFLPLFRFFSGAQAAEKVRDYRSQGCAAYLRDSRPAGLSSVENQGFMNNPAFVITVMAWW